MMIVRVYVDRPQACTSIEYNQRLIADWWNDKVRQSFNKYTDTWYYQSTDDVEVGQLHLGLL